jgi:hypothetical protein
MAAV